MSSGKPLSEKIGDAAHKAKDAVTGRDADTNAATAKASTKLHNAAERADYAAAGSQKSTMSQKNPDVEAGKARLETHAKNIKDTLTGDRH